MTKFLNGVLSLTGDNECWCSRLEAPWIERLYRTAATRDHTGWLCNSPIPRPIVLPAWGDREGLLPPLPQFQDLPLNERARSYVVAILKINAWNLTGGSVSY